MMNAQAKEIFINRASRENRADPFGKKVLWSRHAITEATKDRLTRLDVEKALENAEVIEDYPAQNRPLPDCLILGYLPSDDPVHAVVATDEEQDRIFIVTVYRPSEERWENDWQTRK